MGRLFIIDLDNTIANTTRDLQGDETKVEQLTLTEGAREFLEKFGKETVLLSAGVMQLQQKKLQVLKIQDMFHDVVLVPLPEEKAGAMAAILEKQQVLPSKTIVIGDRVDAEIKAGNLLGTMTVRLRLPEGRYYALMPKSPEEEPNYTVNDFFDLMQLPIF